MAVTSVLLQKETAGDDRDKVVSYTREFKVTHLATDSSKTILASGLVPQVFDAHPDDPFSYVLSRSLSRSIGDGRLVSNLTVQYTSEIEREEEPEDPLARPARISWSTQNERVPVVFDKDDEPIVNDAGDLLLGVEEDRALWQINVSKNVAAVPTWVTSAQNAVNSTVVVIGGLSIDAGLLKLDSISISELQTENNVQFYEIQFKMLLKQGGWSQKLLNVGLREKVTVTDWETGGTATELRPILTASGEQVDEPVFLDSEGKAIRDNSLNPDTLLQPLKTDLTANEIITKTYNTKPEIDFNILPLT